MYTNLTKLVCFTPEKCTKEFASRVNEKLIDHYRDDIYDVADVELL